MPTRRALITGITGQDGSYLAELLIQQGYAVSGIVRRSSGDTLQHIEHLRLARKITIYYGDIRDEAIFGRILNAVQPDEIYNLASQSHVGVSFECPEETMASNYQSVIHLVRAAKRIVPTARIVQISSSEMFGDAPSPQNELTPLNPKSPYGDAKAQAHSYCQQARIRNGLNISTAIMYNHESPRRSKQFVTRKITHSMAKIAAGLQQTLTIGNVDARRDWGYAPDYVQALWLIAQYNKPDDFIVATGATHSVRDFINAAAHHFGMSLFWSGDGINAKATDQTGQLRVTVDRAFFRPTEPHNLVGDTSKIRTTLNWQPCTDFETMVSIMCQNDYRLVTAHE